MSVVTIVTVGVASVGRLCQHGEGGLESDILTSNDV